MSRRADDSHRALLAALAGGAPWSGAFQVAAAAARDPQLAARWKRLASAPDPALALEGAQLVPTFLLSFLLARSSVPLAARAEAAREALRTWRPPSELTSGVRALVLGALMGIGMHAVVRHFVVPVFEMMSAGEAMPLGGIPMFMVALALGVAALWTRLTGRAPSLVAAPSAWLDLLTLFRSSARPAHREETMALRWLDAADRAQVPVAELFRGLVEAAPNSWIGRFAKATGDATRPPDVLDRWKAAGLLSPSVTTAMRGLFAAHDAGATTGRPLARLARLSRMDDDASGIVRERLLLAGGTVALAVGTLQMMHAVWGAVAHLGDFV